MANLIVSAVLALIIAGAFLFFKEPIVAICFAVVAVLCVIAIIIAKIQHRHKNKTLYWD